MIICKMKDDDWNEVSKIYFEAIETGLFTIVSELPTYEEWDRSHHPELRFVAKEKGKIVGFVALSYQEDVFGQAISIYIDTEYRGIGIGSRLLKKILKTSRTYGYENVYALIFYTNRVSMGLHEKLGFSFQRKIKLRQDSRDVYIYKWGD